MGSLRSAFAVIANAKQNTDTVMFCGSK